MNALSGRSGLVAAALAVAVAVLAVVPAGGHAHAQDEPAPGLQLLRQTPFTFPDEPLLEVAVLARNDGDAALEDLTLTVSIFAQVLSHNEFEQTLTSDPGAGVVATRTASLDDPLPVGGERQISISVPMDVPGVSKEQSYVYPVKVDLLSAGVPVATLRTGVVFVVREPETPLALNWRVSLTAPWSLDPSGVFTSPALEQEITEGGPLRGVVDALSRATAGPQPVPADVVISPLLLVQLERMNLGYRVLDGQEVRVVRRGEGGAAAAGRMLEDLRAVAAAESIELVAQPFAAPTYPSLFNGLSSDLGLQIERGREAVERLVGPPDAEVDAPVASAIDDRVVKRLAARGVRRLLLDADALPSRVQEPGFTASPTSAIAVDDQLLAAIAPEPAVQTLLVSETASTDPVLAAQQALAALGTIWLELPGVERGLALSIPTDASAGLAPAMINRLVAVYRTRPARFLGSRTATQLAAAFPPSDAPTAFVELDERTFGQAYGSAIKSARRGVAAYRSMLVEPGPGPDVLERDLLVAEGSQFLGDESGGLSYVEAVAERTGSVFGAVRPETAELITLSSSRGTIPVRLVNETGDPVTVRVELISDQLAPGPSYVREVQLDEPERTIAFTVALDTTGQIPVRVVVSAPSGRPINETTIAVRSTAYNRVALIITLGAALVLLALWSRRYFPRRKK